MNLYRFWIIKELSGIKEQAKNKGNNNLRQYFPQALQGMDSKLQHKSPWLDPYRDSGFTKLKKMK